MKKALKTILAAVAVIVALSFIGSSQFAQAVIRAPFTSDVEM